MCHDIVIAIGDRQSNIKTIFVVGPVAIAGVRCAFSENTVPSSLTVSP